MEYSTEERLHVVEHALHNLVKGTISKKDSCKLLEQLKEILSNKLLVPTKDHLDVSEACQFLNISKSHLYKLTHNKVLPYYKTGKKNYFKRDDLISYITQYRVMSKRELSIAADKKTDNLHV